eukprot:746686-Hanusia_phi.AAC.2
MIDRSPNLSSSSAQKRAFLLTRQDENIRSAACASLLRRANVSARNQDNSRDAKHSLSMLQAAVDSSDGIISSKLLLSLGSHNEMEQQVVACKVFGAAIASRVASKHRWDYSS